MIDERFLMHRYKSTSHASVVGGVLMGSWFLYEHIAHHRIHWDILIIMLSMAVTKIGFLIYYRLSD